MKIKLSHLYTTSLIVLIIVLFAISSVQASTTSSVAIFDNNTTGGGQITSLSGNNNSTTGGMQLDAAEVSAQYNYRDDTDSSKLDHGVNKLSKSRRALLACVSRRARSASKR